MIDDINKRLSGKCRWYDVLETSGSTVPIQFKNNRLYSVQEKENSGLGIRANVKGKTGFSYSNDRGNLDAVIDRALSLSAYGDDEGFDLPGEADASFDTYDENIKTFNVHGEISLAREAIKAITGCFPGAHVDVSISRYEGRMSLVNSRGFNASYRSSMYSAGISLTNVMDDGTKIDVWEGRSFAAPADYSFLVGRVIERAQQAEKRKTCSSSRIPVVLTPKAAARMLGIVASGLNAKSVWKGISPFADKKGKPLFSRYLTVHDDPLVPGSPFSYPFDDEGVVAGRKPLIQAGVVTTFVTDLKHAHRLGIEPTGNASRGYGTLPAPSFSNAIVAGGSEPLHSILKSLDRGILVDQFIGLGQSNTLTGEFSAGLDLAYLVEKGEITGRVKDCMITDNLFDLLAGDIVMSSEREQSGSTLIPYILLPQVNYTG